MLSTIEAMAKELSSEEKELISVVDPFIVPIVELRAFCLMRELAFCSGFPDHSLLIGLTLGLPALGWSCKAPTMRVRTAEPQLSLKDLEEGADEHNAKVIRSTKPSGDANLDMASWLKTMEEVNANVVLGPFRHLDEIPFRSVRLLRRFGTWELHGEQSVPKVRNIDDALEGGQNAASGSQHTHIPTDLDLWINQRRMAQELCPNDEIKQFASDFASAYKRVAGDPALAGLAVIFQWSQSGEARSSSSAARNSLEEELPGELCTCARLLVPCHGKPGRHGDEPLRGRHACGGKGGNNLLRLQSVEKCGSTCRLGRATQEISTPNVFSSNSGRPVRPLPDPPQPTPDPRHGRTCQKTPGSAQRGPPERKTGVGSGWKVVGETAVRQHANIRTHRTCDATCTQPPAARRRTIWPQPAAEVMHHLVDPPPSEARAHQHGEAPGHDLLQRR